MKCTYGIHPLISLAVERLLPNSAQPRKSFDDSALFSLSESIKQNGILQPLTVRRLDSGEYMLISGERRLRAAKIAGLKKVPCIVVKTGEQGAAVLALLENLQREDLDCFDEADGINTLIQRYGFSRDEIAARMGFAQSTISNKLRLLRLTGWQRERIKCAGLSERHARALIRIDDPKLRDRLLLTIIANDLNVNDTEKLVEQAMNSDEPEPPAKQNFRPVLGDMRLITNTISGAVESMRRSGVSATAEKRETERYIEYRIIISKTAAEQMKLIEL